jgi:hypothetical protein
MAMMQFKRPWSILDVVSEGCWRGDHVSGRNLPFIEYQFLHQCVEHIELWERYSHTSPSRADDLYRTGREAHIFCPVGLRLFRWIISQTAHAAVSAPQT